MLPLLLVVPAMRLATRPPPHMLPTAPLSAPMVSVCKPTHRVRANAPDMQLGGLGKGVGDFMKNFGGGPQDGLSDEEKASMEQRFKSGEMSFNDFLTQVNIMQKAGSLQQFMSRTPFGGGGGPNSQQLAEGEKKLKRYREFVEAMDEQERLDTSLLIAEDKELRSGANASPERMTRIATATGATLDQISTFISEFDTLRSAAVKFARGDSPEKIRKEMMEEKAQSMPKNRAQRRAAKRGRPGAVKARPGSGGFGGR